MSSGRLYSNTYGTIDIEGSSGLAVQSLANAVTSVGSLTSSANGALTSGQDGALTSSQAVAFTLASDVLAPYNQVQADVAALRTAYNQAQTDLAALRTSYNAAQVDVASLRTTVNALLTSLRSAGFVTP